MSSLDCECTITDSSGEQVLHATYDGVRHWQGFRPPHVIPILFLRTFEKGHYTITFNVTRGVPALVNSEQRLLGGYELCGMEALPAFIGGMFSLIATILAAILAGTTYLVSRYRRRKRAPAL